MLATTFSFPNPVNEKAARVVAFVVMLLAVITLASSAYWLLVMLILAAGLESVLAFCVGCRIFALLMRAGLIPEGVCADCADIGGPGRSAGAGA